MAIIKGIKQNKPVEFTPYVKSEGYSKPLDDKEFFILDAESVQPFIDELADLGVLHIIKDTLQCLCERSDGTVLNTAFPCLKEFISITNKMKKLPNELLDRLKEWRSLGANEIEISFELKRLSEH